MKTKDTLHQLIHSLNKSEKRAFKLFQNKYKKNVQSNSTQLFDILNAQKKYDEEKIKKALKGQKLLKNLTYEKHKLQQIILDFLAHQANSKDPAYLLNTLHNQLMILVNKEQWDLCVKLSERGIRLAKEHNQTIHLFQFYRIRLNLILWVENYSAELRDELLENIQTTQNLIFSEMEYYQLYTKMVHLFRYKRLTIKQYIDDFYWLTTSPFFQDESMALTFESKIYLFDIKGSYYEMIQDFEQSAFYQKKIIGLFEETSAILEKRLYDFFVYQFNYTRTLIIAYKIPEAEKYLGKIHKELYPKYKDQFDEDIANAYDGFYTTMLLALLQEKHDYHQIYQILSKDIEDKKLSYNEYRKVEAFTFSIISCFALKKYNKGIEHFATFEKKVDTSLYLEEYFTSRIFVFLSYYELRYFTILNSLFDSLYYHIRKNELESSYFKIILKIFRKLIQNGETKGNQNFLINVKEEFLETDYKTKFGGELFLFWIESKIQKKDLLEIIEENKPK